MPVDEKPPGRVPGLKRGYGSGGELSIEAYAMRTLLTSLGRWLGGGPSARYARAEQQPASLGLARFSALTRP